MIPCKTTGCIYNIHPNPNNNGGKHCCLSCKNNNNHGTQCKKDIAKCNNCNYKRHTNEQNNNGNHCCYTCEVTPGIHGAFCEKTPYEDKFPKQIFICDKTLKFISKYSLNWKKLNPEYDIILFDDERCKKFLLEEFGEKYVDIFEYITSGPIKADFWRVCILYSYGGLYVDADVEPLLPLSEYIDFTADFVTCSSYGNKLAFNPNFIMAKAGDEIIKSCIDGYVKMYDLKIEFSYWGWSIMTMMNNVLQLVNYNKESGIYTVDTKKYQILKEICGPNFFEDHNIYDGKRVFNNRYKTYDPPSHSFKE